MVAAVMVLILFGTGTGGTVAAATPDMASATPAIENTMTTASQQSSGLVFSLGELAAVDARSITLTFDGGHAETYRLTGDTAVQTQNGDQQTVQDLDVGAMVVVISHEDDPTAVVVVNGGDAGFHEAGPADMRGHERDGPCAPCATPPAGR